MYQILSQTGHFWQNYSKTPMDPSSRNRSWLPSVLILRGMFRGIANCRLQQILIIAANATRNDVGQYSGSWFQVTNSFNVIFDELFVFFKQISRSYNNSQIHIYFLFLSDFQCLPGHKEVSGAGALAVWHGLMVPPKIIVTRRHHNQFSVCSPF